MVYAVFSNPPSIGDSAPMTRRRDHGFALLVVLWTLALLALLGSHVTATARNATARASAIRAGAEAQVAAEGLVRQAIFRLLDSSPRRWTADSRPHEAHRDGRREVVTIEDHAGRINPNATPPALMAALLKQVGVADPAAAGLAQSIAEWRSYGSAQAYAAAGLSWAPPREPFATINEMALVRGMTPEVLDRLRPHITVYTDGRVDLGKASALVGQLLLSVGDSRPPPPQESTILIAEISALATVPGGRAFRRVVVRVDPSEDETADAFHVLAWD